MKKIELITPLGSASPLQLSSIKGKYLRKIRTSGSDPVQYLNLVLDELILTLKPSAYIEFVEFLIQRFDEIIIAEPHDLEKFISMVTDNGWQTILDDDQQFNTKIKEAYGYKERFRSNVNRGVWYAEMLNIKTCPYCNSQYTLVVKGSKNRTLAKFQFDHFYSKSRFPFLSLSMYNLIPSCASCNLAKTAKDYDLDSNYHPYYLNLAEYLTFKIVKPENLQNLSIERIRQLKDDEIEIGLDTPFDELETFVRNHYLDFDFEGLYNRHKDIVKEVMIKAKLYQGKGITYPTNIKGLFEDQHSVAHYLLGNYMHEDEILERPLSKMMRDLAIQLKLIR